MKVFGLAMPIELGGMAMGMGMSGGATYAAAGRADRTRNTAAIAILIA